MSDVVSSLSWATLDAEHPWPGLEAFREGDANWFRGRDSEAMALHRLVKRALTSVVFGRSGVGKSSLLQAGLFPRLREQDFLPVYVRLAHHDQDRPLSEQIFAALAREAAEQTVEAPAIAHGESLWEHFHREGSAYWSRDNRPLDPVLVIDQFEDVFTVGRASPTRATRTEAFLEELADLAEGRIPTAIKHRIDTGELDPQIFDTGRHSYRVLLAIREDYLAELETLRMCLPSVAENRLRIGGITGLAALETTQAGGELLVSRTVGERIVRLLAGQSRDRKLGEFLVDPVLISLFCQELNERRLRVGQGSIRDIDVTEDARDEIVRQLYRRAVDELSGGVPMFLEEALLARKGHRGSGSSKMSREHIAIVSGASRSSREAVTEESAVAVGGQRIGNPPVRAQSPAASIAPTHIPKNWRTAAVGSLVAAGMVLAFWRGVTLPNAQNSTQAINASAGESDSAALADLTARCANRDGASCWEAGRIYDAGEGIQRSYAKAAELYQVACDNGYAEGCRELAGMYSEPRGMAEDPAHAADLLAKGCDSAAIGCLELGKMYSVGRGVPENAEVAAARYLTSCKNETSQACILLGVMRAAGRGVPQDPVLAEDHFQEACEDGEAAGCLYLGISLAEGRGRAKDPTRGGILLRQACEGGIAEACARLATMNKDGARGQNDLARARVLFLEACQLGDAGRCSQALHGKSERE